MWRARHSRHLVLLLAFACLGAGTAAAADAPSSVGTWEHNRKESIGMPDPEQRETVEIRRYDSVLDYTWTGAAADGTTSTFSYASPADGKVRELPGSPGLRGSMTRTPSGIIEAKLWFPDGAWEEKYCLLSSPTRLTCFATYSDSDGKIALFKQIFDRRQQTLEPRALFFEGSGGVRLRADAWGDPERPAVLLLHGGG